MGSALSVDTMFDHAAGCDLGRLGDVLSGMDVPGSRRDLSVRANLEWLCAHLVVRNGGHLDFTEAIWLIRCRLDEIG
jgi:hypothetical protein